MRSRHQLTPTQAIVLTEAVTGESIRVMASRLGMAEATVKTHVTAILQKLNVDSRAQLIAHVARHAGVDLRASALAFIHDTKGKPNA